MYFLFVFCLSNRHILKNVPLLLHNYLKILEVRHLRFCNDKIQMVSSLQNGDTQPPKRKEGCEKQDQRKKDAALMSIAESLW